MEDTITKTLVDMGVQLTQLAVKGTASTVTKKIKAAKEEKSIESLRTTYNELINEVISEREEAISIAQAYKSEIDRIVISEDDMKQLQNTVARLIGIFSTGENNNTANQVKELITVDTLKTMQLLGFNYKSAIGEPLTELCSNAISSLGNKNKSTISKGKK